jgi:methyl-accepting chemotaxis protein
MLSRFGILTKIISVIVLIGVIVAGCFYYVTTQMAAVDANYARFLQRDVQAGALTRSANRALYQIRYIVWRLIAETDDAVMKNLANEYENAWKELDSLLGEIKEKAPAAFVSRIDRFAARATGTLKPNLEPVVKLARANKAEEATKLNQANAALYRELVDEANKIRDAIADDVSKGASALSNQASAAAQNSLIAISVGMAIGIGAAVVIVLFGITRPIRSLVQVLLRMAQGDFNIEIAESARRDELGEIGRAVEAIKAKAAEKAQAEAAEKAEADARAAAQRKADMQKLADQFESAVGSIIDTVSASATELEAAASTLTHTAETTQQLSTTAAAASEEASANVQSVASATEELSSSVTEIGEQVERSTKIATEAVAQAEKADARVNELAKAADRIGDVVKLITTIAEQTNLLALNATIEAARAGDAGKGFAVVAQEVKALAAQTAKATGEIAAQISGMQTTTADSVAAIREINTTITNISEISASIAAAVQEQNAATGEIARNIAGAAQGTTQVAGNIVEVSKGASETGSASAQVLASAQSLSHEGNRLKLEVDKFLQTVRAA